MSQDGSLPQVADDAVNPEPIICPYITSVQLDSNLGDFIKHFKNSGVVDNYGALLVESLPDSRPRPLGLCRISRTDPWPVSAMAVTPKIEGLYVLQMHDLNIADTTWPKQVEAASKTPAATLMNLTSFVEALKSGASTGAQVLYLPAHYGGVNIRALLAIKMFPVANGAVLRAVSPIGTRDILSGNFITISTPGSATCVQKTAAQLTSVLYHHRGKPRLWIVVPPGECKTFEGLVRELFRDELGITGTGAGEGERGKGIAEGKRLCSQFVAHLNLWITPELLRSWGVRFSQVLLREKQMLLLFPGSYYWTMSTGFSIVETKAVAGLEWTLKGYRFCEGAYGLCKPKVTFVIKQKAVNDALAVEAARKARTDEKRKRRKAKTEDKEDGTASTPSSPGGSGYEGDESFNANPDADYIPVFPNLRAVIPRTAPQTPARPGTATANATAAHPSTPSAQHEDQSPPPPSPAPSSAEAAEIPADPERLLAENASLRTQVGLLAAQVGLYVTAVDRQRTYYGILERQLEKKAPEVEMWRGMAGAALKALEVAEGAERERRVREEEGGDRMEEDREGLAEEMIVDGGLGGGRDEGDVAVEEESAGGLRAEGGAPLSGEEDAAEDVEMSI